MFNSMSLLERITFLIYCNSNNFLLSLYLDVRFSYYMNIQFQKRKAKNILIFFFFGGKIREENGQIKTV